MSCPQPKTSELLSLSQTLNKSWLKLQVMSLIRSIIIIVGHVKKNIAAVRSGVVQHALPLGLAKCKATFEESLKTTCKGLLLDADTAWFNGMMTFIIHFTAAEIIKVDPDSVFFPSWMLSFSKTASENPEELLYPYYPGEHKQYYTISVCF